MTSVIKSVLGRNGSCTLHGRGVHMPLVFHLLSCFSRFLVQKVSSRRLCMAKVTGLRVMYTTHLGGHMSAWRGVVFVRTICRCLFCSSLSNDARFRREDLHVKVCPWCGVGLLFSYLFFTRSAASYKITLLFGFGGSR